MIRLRPINRWLEPFFALLIAYGIAYAMIHLYVRGYLPQPFFYDTWDTWMDWFNVADWSYDRGVYDTFGSIYPPLSFVLMRLLSLPHCYLGGSGSGITSYYARDCDWLGIVWVHAFYVADIVLVATALMKVDRRTALPRAVAIGMGLPLATALERGQIVLITFACVILAFSPILKSARMRWLGLGLAINFKIYLITLLFPQLLRRRWRWFEGAAITTLLIYLVTFCILGAGTPMEIISNAIGYKASAASPLDTWLASTYNPLLALAQDPVYNAMATVGSDVVEYGELILVSALRLTQGTVLIAVIAAWLRPEVVPIQRMTLLGLSLSMITVDAQYYSVSILIYFLFLERWEGIWSKLAILMGYLMSVPLDYAIDPVPPLALYSYLSGRMVIVEFSVMLAPLLRPGLMLFATFCIAMGTITTVWADIRRQGWRERWRFRHDLPIMVGKGAASPPAGFAPVGHPA